MLVVIQVSRFFASGIVRKTAKIPPLMRVSPEKATIKNQAKGEKRRATM